MTYNVFGGTLNLAQSINQSVMNCNAVTIHIIVIDHACFPRAVFKVLTMRINAQHQTIGLHSVASSPMALSGSV